MPGPRGTAAPWLYPAAWRGKLVTLRIGGAHRETTLFVNGQRIGEHQGFSAPFTFDVTDAVRPGGENVIALRIANPGAVPLEGPREQKPVRPTGMLNYIGNWGGIYGNVELSAAERTSIDRVYVRPDVERRSATFVVAVQNRDAREYAGEVRVTVAPGVEGRAPLTVSAGGRADVEVMVAIPDARLWSPEQPHLYTAAITLRQGGRERDRVDERFGMRRVTTRGNVLLLNGKPLYLRGYGDDNIEVLTGFPPASREVYLQRLKQARSFGFNAVRFHSMTPSEEFFRAADEVGLLRHGRTAGRVHAVRAPAPGVPPQGARRRRADVPQSTVAAVAGVWQRVQPHVARDRGGTQAVPRRGGRLLPPGQVAAPGRARALE